MIKATGELMTWKEILNDDVLKQLNEKALAQVIEKIEMGENIFPPTQINDGKISHTQIYRAFDLTSFDNLKVVILGQDPYHEQGQANGLAFSVYDGVKMPPSLRNMFKELQSDLGGEIRRKTDLSDWAEQGVLLLNTALSVVEGKANSMADIWAPFTDRLIQLIDENKSPVVFVLWGGNAKKKIPLIKNNRDYIIQAAHPSPLSAYRGFFDSKPYSKINATLKSLGLKEINWNNTDR